MDDRFRADPRRHPPRTPRHTTRDRERDARDGPGRRLAPLIAARTAAAAAHGQASGDDLACFGPDITAQTVLDACGARAWWLEGGQIKHQVVTAPAAPKAGP